MTTTPPILLADPRVAAVPVHETFQPLVALGPAFGPARARVRAGLAVRLRLAQVALPVGLRLCVLEGHRSAATQRALIAELGIPAVAPLEVAPHVAGAAVDVTLANVYGDPLDPGTVADRHLDDLAAALTGVGLVNYPERWWHWSYGDRYWALVTGAPAALYGPVDDFDDPTTAYGAAA
jgi:D-alanyl-D-alanine dipeptidase